MNHRWAQYAVERSQNAVAAWKRQIESGEIVVTEEFATALASLDTASFEAMSGGPTGGAADDSRRGFGPTGDLTTVRDRLGNELICGDYHAIRLAAWAEPRYFQRQCPDGQRWHCWLGDYGGWSCW